MSIKKAHYSPTEAEIDACEHNMNMSQLKDPKSPIFAKMPKSVLVNGKRIPRTALRKRDLCRLYLTLGGKLQRKEPRVLKHYTQPAKPSIEQKKYQKIVEQRSLDHTNSKKKPSLTKKRQASISPSKHKLSLRRQLLKMKLVTEPDESPEAVENDDEWDLESSENDY